VHLVGFTTEMYLKIRRNLGPTVLYNLHQSTSGYKYSYGMGGMQYCEHWQREQYSIQVCEYKSLLQNSNKKAGDSLSCPGRNKIKMPQCCKTCRLRTTTACVLQTGNISLKTVTHVNKMSNLAQQCLRVVSLVSHLQKIRTTQIMSKYWNFTNQPPLHFIFVLDQVTYTHRNNYGHFASFFLFILKSVIKRESVPVIK